MITTTTSAKKLGKGFSKEAIRRAVTQNTVRAAKDTKLNELANEMAAELSSTSISPRMVRGYLSVIEFALLSLVGVSLYLFSLMPGETVGPMYLLAGFVAATFYTGFAQGMDAFLISSLRRFSNSVFKSISALAVTLMTLCMLAFVLHGFNLTLITWLGSWFTMSIGVLSIARFATSIYVSRLIEEGKLERRAIIVGGGASAAELIHSMEANPDSDIRICGIFDDRGGNRSPEIVAGYPKLGTVCELIEFSRRARINMLILAIPINAESRVLQLLKRLWVLPVDIRLSAHANKLYFRPRSYTYEGAVPFVDVFEKPIADWDSVKKRAFDIVFASLALVALSPIMLMAALAVKLDSKGPVFFRQKREGFNNEHVHVLKFRSLKVDQQDSSGLTMVTRNDNRVTRVGRFIRKTSIDELPQLINVLQGSLSLVGPRPHVPEARTGNRLWNEVVDSYFARHKVKPGVTGWAQINGWRGEVDTEEKLRGRVEADLYYIENWSVFLDLKILFLTPFKLFNDENAF